MNKNKGFSVGRMAASVFLAALFITSCPASFDQQKTEQQELPPGYGSFTLNVSNDPLRTIMPASSSFGLGTFAAFRLEFTPTSGGEGITVDQPRNTSGPQQPAVILAAGTYNLTVKAYKDTAKTQLAAKGTTSNITITPGQTTNGNVELKALFNEGNGTFMWAITLSPGNGITIDTATMTILKGNVQQNPVVDLKTTPSGTRTLASGLYTVVFDIKDTTNNKTLVWNETLHVYSSLDSTFTKTFDNTYFTNTHWDVTFYENFFNTNVLIGSKQSVMHGGKLSSFPTLSSKAAPAGLYQGTMPSEYTLEGWYDGNYKWNLSTDVVTGNVELKAYWTNTGGTRIDTNTVSANNIAAAVTYVNEKATVATPTYTLLLNNAQTLSTGINLTNNAAKLTVEGLGTTTTAITTTGSFNVQNSAALTIGKNITFPGNGGLVIDSGASLTLSDNAAVNKLTLTATEPSSETNSSVTIAANWTGSVTTLNLLVNTNDINTVISLWVTKEVLKGNVTAITAAKFKNVYFVTNSADQQDIKTANGPLVPNGYIISSDIADKGKLIIVPVDEVSVDGTTMTLTAAIAGATGTTETDPAVITLLRNITVPPPPNSGTSAYTIVANKHIKLIVATNQDRTITASAGNFCLFTVSSNASLTLDVPTGSTLTLYGNNEEAQDSRRGVSVSGSGGSFTMGNGVTITGFKNSSAGGGVYIYRGTFNMSNNAVIKGNYSALSGGGVYMADNAENPPIFNMSGGEIMNNDCNNFGGGVFVGGHATFTMSGGTIYGINNQEQKNTASTGTGAAISAAVAGTAKYGDSSIIQTTNDTITGKPGP